jgi:hypothetical protein
MKKGRRRQIRLIGMLFAVAVTIGPVIVTIAAGKKEARVTQVVRDVQLLASNAAPRPASVNDNVGPGTVVRAGSDSRAEVDHQIPTAAKSQSHFARGGEPTNFAAEQPPDRSDRPQYSRSKGCGVAFGDSENGPRSSVPALSDSSCPRTRRLPCSNRSGNGQSTGANS